MTPGLWEAIQDDLRTKIDEDSYQAWFRQVESEERKNTLIIWVPTLFHKDWIDNHYKDDISRSATRQIGKDVKVKVMCRPTGSQKPQGEAQLEKKKGMGVRLRSVSPSADFLNPLYLFENFVVGASNQFAHAACMAVAESPAHIYNPLLIYGGSGLGKTHLMQAIGHHMLQKNPEAKIIYCTSEEFTNEYINSVKDNRMDAFHRKYRSVELLLVDDVQFLANRERSQEEFFHTFNALYESHRQLVISSDRHPRQIPQLQERLKSRLEWGLTTDIQPPNLEHRIAILRKNADDMEIDIPNDCVEYIAEKVKTNIRNLRGALMNVSAKAALMNRSINMEQVQETLRDITESHRDTRITVDQIQKVVAEYFKVSTADMKGKRRSSDVTLPRQIAMYLCREITGLSLPVIGSEFGGRDHTTVLHSCKKIAGLLERDRTIQTMITDVRSSLAK